MLPAVENRIPVVVRNTSRPEYAGTRILAEAPPVADPVKSIVYKRGIILITVASTRMFLQSGFMAKIFEVFARYDLSVDLVATSEVTVSVTVDTFGTSRIDEDKIAGLVRKHFDLTPYGIVETLDLLRPIYKPTAAYGHFGRPEFSWERTDVADDIQRDAGL